MLYSSIFAFRMLNTMSQFSGIDHDYFPDIMDSIQEAASLSTLLKMRQTSSAYNQPKQDLRIKKALARSLALVPVGLSGDHELTFRGRVPSFMAHERIPLATNASGYKLDPASLQLIKNTKILDINTPLNFIDELPPFPPLNLIRLYLLGPVAPLLPKCHTVVIGSNIQLPSSITISPSRVKRIVFLGDSSAHREANGIVRFTVRGKIDEVVFVNRFVAGLGEVNLSTNVLFGLLSMVNAGVKVGRAVLVNVTGSDFHLARGLMFNTLDRYSITALASIKISMMTTADYDRVSKGYAKGR